MTINQSHPLAIIVGAGSRLGLALAKKFAKENFAVALISRNKASLQSLVEDINKSAGKAFAFSADVTKKEEVTSVFDEIHSQFGAAKILIYNAASKFELNGISDINIDNFIESWKINCLGGLLTTQCVLPQMVAKKHGTIIFSGATAALRGSARMANFAVGKFSQRALAHLWHVNLDHKVSMSCMWLSMDK